MFQIIAMIHLIVACAPSIADVQTASDLEVFEDQRQEDNQLDNNQFENNQLDNNQLDNNQLDNNQLDDNQLDNNQLDDNQLDDNQLDNNQLENNQLGNNQLGNNQLPDDQFANNNQLEQQGLNNQLNQQAVEQLQFEDSQFDDNQIQDSSIEPISDSEGIDDLVTDQPPVSAEQIPLPNKFSGAPPVPGTLRALAGGEAPAEYRIEAGDTLFDICDQLLDEPEYWPKLWSLNRTIKNPHFIYPNFVLQFFAGSDDDPPAIRVVGVDELEGEDIDENMVAESTDGLFKVEVEPELELLNPEEIVVPTDIRELFNYQDAMNYRDNLVVQLPAIIVKDELAQLGKIVGSIEGSLSIQDNDIGYVEGSDIEEGSTYTVVRYRERVYYAGKFRGYRYDFVSVAKVKKFTGESKTARAHITKSSALTRAGDLLVEFKSRTRRLPFRGESTSEASAKIVNLSNAGQTMGAIGDFVFLAFDIADGVSDNQVLKIFKNPKARARVSQASSSEPFQIGTAQILDVNDEIATAYILDADQEVYLGDKVGSE